MVFLSLGPLWISIDRPPHEYQTSMVRWPAIVGKLHAPKAVGLSSTNKKSGPSSDLKCPRRRFSRPNLERIGDLRNEQRVGAVKRKSRRAKQRHGQLIVGLHSHNKPAPTANLALKTALFCLLLSRCCGQRTEYARAWSFTSRSAQQWRGLVAIMNTSITV